MGRFRTILSQGINWLPRGPAQQAALRLGGGTAIAQGLVVLTTPLITRLYTPSEMGQFGLMLSFVAFASVALSLRYDMAIVPAATDEEADRLLIVATAVIVPMVLMAAVLMRLLVYLDLLSFGDLPLAAVAMVAVLLLATGLFGAVRYWAIRQHEFGAIARASVAQGVGRAVFPVGAGVLGAGWSGLILGELAGRMFGVAPLMQIAASRVRTSWKQSTWSSLWSSAVLNWRYPAIVTPSSLLDALGGALPLPMVADAFGAAAAGQLFMVQRLAAVSASLVGASVADVFHAKVSLLFRDNPSAVRPAVWRTVSQLAAVACAIYLPLGLVSIWGFSLIFGNAWIEAGYLVALFTPLSIASLAVSPVTRLYLVVNRPELKLIFDVGFIAVPFISFVLLRGLGVGFWGCMTAYAALATAAYFLQLALTLWAAGLTPRDRGDSIRTEEQTPRQEV